MTRRTGTLYNRWLCTVKVNIKIRIPYLAREPKLLVVVAVGLGAQQVAKCLIASRLHAGSLGHPIAVAVVVQVLVPNRWLWAGGHGDDTGLVFTNARNAEDFDHYRVVAWCQVGKKAGQLVGHASVDGVLDLSARCACRHGYRSVAGTGTSFGRRCGADVGYKWCDRYRSGTGRRIAAVVFSRQGDRVRTFVPAVKIIWRNGY